MTVACSTPTATLRHVYGTSTAPPARRPRAAASARGRGARPAGATPRRPSEGCRPASGGAASTRPAACSAPRSASRITSRTALCLDAIGRCVGALHGALHSRCATQCATRCLVEQCAHAAGEPLELLAVHAVHVEARQPRQHLARQRGRRWRREGAVRAQCGRREGAERAQRGRTGHAWGVHGACMGRAWGVHGVGAGGAREGAHGEAQGA